MIGGRRDRTRSNLRLSNIRIAALDKSNSVSDAIDEAPDDQGEIVATAATIAVVAVGAALFEVALLPGLALGAAAALAPRVLPNLGTAMAPMFRSSVRGVYRLGQRTREMVAEAHEHVNDIVAEANAEDRSKAATAAKATAPAA